MDKLEDFNLYFLENSNISLLTELRKLIDADVELQLLIKEAKNLQKNIVNLQHIGKELAVLEQEKLLVEVFAKMNSNPNYVEYTHNFEEYDDLRILMLHELNLFIDSVKDNE